MKHQYISLQLWCVWAMTQIWLLMDFVLVWLPWLVSFAATSVDLDLVTCWMTCIYWQMACFVTVISNFVFSWTLTLFVPLPSVLTWFYEVTTIVLTWFYEVITNNIIGYFCEGLLHEGLPLLMIVFCIYASLVPFCKFQVLPASTYLCSVLS